jgi:hypothetical protein
MAETERDEKVSAGYRALGSEEPPRALDEAILAASRRSPARWRVPLSIAAVLVLAVGVTLRMLPQQPDAESVALAPQVIETPRPASAPPAQLAQPAKPKEQAKLAARAAPVPEPAAAPAVAGAAAENRMRSEVARSAAADSVRRDEAGAGARLESRATAEASAPRAAAAPAAAGVGMLAKKSELTPEAWLARIAELRKQGRAKEADESLAEFRKRYPDYKIPETAR